MQRREFLQTAVGTVFGAQALPAGFAEANQAGRRPNILFCIADDATYSHFGAYGCDWVNTPGFDRVANEGILFTHAYTPNAKCAPSRASLLTGRNSWQLEAAANHWPRFPHKFKTYSEVLLENGYHVGYTGKGWAPGIAETADGNPRRLLGRGYHQKKADPPTSHISRTDYAANFKAFLNEKPEGQPFCFWYGAREPHRSYEFASGITKGGKKPSDVDDVYGFWPDNQTVRIDMLDYALEIEHFDNHLRSMLAVLEARGELDNTLVIVTSDNGMPFPRIKGQEYEYSNHMPLAMMWKDGIKNPGRTVDDFVSFIDLAPTYLELAQVSEKQSGMQPITGESLIPIFQSPRGGRIEPQREHVLIGKERHDVGRPHNRGYPIRGIVKGDYLYLYNFEPDRWPVGHPFTGYLNTDGSPTKTECIDAYHVAGKHKYWFWNLGKRPMEELYNIRRDPDCVVNLAFRSQHQQLKQQLRDQLFAELRRQNDPRVFGRGEIFDHYEYADDNWRSFYEKKKNGDPRVPGWANATDFHKIYE